jgi:UDP-glucuronate decarboxylase
LCERLLNENNEVICLDNFFTGSKQNISHLQNHPYFELIRHDVINPIFLEVDEIYNLACPASPIHYQYNPIKTIKTSVMGAINMLGLAKRPNQKYCKHQQAKYMEIPKSILNLKNIGVMLTPLALAHATMKVKDAPSRFS